MKKYNPFQKQQHKGTSFISVFYLLVRFGVWVGYALYRIALWPWLQGQCRFMPSCSLYAKEAFETLPLFRALFLTLRRLLKCHPWGSFESDPLPSFSQVRCLCKNSKKI